MGDGADGEPEVSFKGNYFNLESASIDVWAVLAGGATSASVNLAATLADGWMVVAQRTKPAQHPVNETTATCLNPRKVMIGDAKHSPGTPALPVQRTGNFTWQEHG